LLGGADLLAECLPLLRRGKRNEHGAGVFEGVLLGFPSECGTELLGVGDVGHDLKGGAETAAASGWPSCGVQPGAGEKSPGLVAWSLFLLGIY
jgi:hypothetical protein